MPKDIYRDIYNENTPLSDQVALFDSAEEVWFWFMASIEAKEDGALCGKGNSEVIRPCEPNDIYQVINRLHRNRILLMDHFRVLSHYGKRGYAPDPRRQKEVRSYYLWKEALEKIETCLVRKGIAYPRLRLVK